MLKILPLGGCYEIGMNLMVLSTGDDLLVIDCGIGFPGKGYYGVEIVIPDFSYLVENRKKVRGIVISHGHEDHIGAVPFLLNLMDAPVYSTEFPARLISKKCLENSVDPDIRIIKQFETISLGAFQVTLFPVSHSIVETSAMKISIGEKTIVFMSDFKIADERAELVSNFKKLDLIGCDLLFLDSTNAEVGGWSGSEKSIQPAITEIAASATGKIFFTTFASNVKRVQTAIDIAKSLGRKIFFMGRSMHLYTQVARDLGYLNVKDRDVEVIENLEAFSDDRVFILATGSQGEERSAMKRMSLDEMRLVNVTRDDTMIFSSKVIPGNERDIKALLNDLAKLGARIFYEGTAKIHVSGHAKREELKFVIETLKPANFIPVHGEYRFLCENARIARSIGIKEQNIKVLENGREVYLCDESFQDGAFHELTPVSLDFVNRDPIDSEVLRERKKIAKVGMLFILLEVDRRKKTIVRGPRVRSRAFTSGKCGDEFFRSLEAYISSQVKVYLRQLNFNSPGGDDDLKEYVSLHVRRFSKLNLKIKPLILCEIVYS